MANWLLKTEPDVYSYDDLVRDKRTTWDGVANNTALIHIRNARKGDIAIIYHTADQRAAVGIAQIISDPYPDPNADDPKLAVFDIKPKARLKTPVTLPQIKADPAFEGWDLLRIARLSVVPTSDAQLKRLLQISGTRL